MVHLTDLEKDVINAVANNEYSNELGDWIWSFSIHYGCKLAKRGQISGIVSSLVKKGILLHDELTDEVDDTVKLTESGILAYNEIKAQGGK